MNFQKLYQTVDTFPMTSVLCIGDMMLDEYISGSVNRLSPEAPVPVICRQTVRQVLGGVGNVAANLTALGCGTHVIYAAAKDAEADTIQQMLVKQNIHAFPFTAGSVTTKKQRIIAQKQQICRIDSEEQLNLTKQQEDKIIYEVSQLLPRVNSVLISDYNKGFITPRITQAIIQETNKSGKYILVDPKGSDYTKYKGATLIKPNLNEFKAAIKQWVPFETSIDSLNPENPQDLKKLEQLASLMREQLDIKSVVVTLGEYGMLASSKGNTFYRPTVAKAVSDVSGAGDTSLAVLGATLTPYATVENSLENALNLANIGAGIVVGKEGTATLSAAELKSTIKTIFNNDASVLWKNVSTRTQSQL